MSVICAQKNRIPIGFIQLGNPAFQNEHDIVSAFLAATL
jgi:hypothetical protein